MLIFRLGPVEHEFSCASLHGDRSVGERKVLPLKKLILIDFVGKFKKVQRRRSSLFVVHRCRCSRN